MGQENPAQVFFAGVDGRNIKNTSQITAMDAAGKILKRASTQHAGAFPAELGRVFRTDEDGGGSQLLLESMRVLFHSVNRYATV